MTKPAAAPDAPSAIEEGPPTPGARRRGRLERILWALFLVLDVPLVLAVATGLAGAYVSPRLLWWAQLAAIALPLLAWALAAATLGPILFRRWGWLALHVVLLGLVLGRAFPSERFTEAGAPGADDFVLMTFNVPQSGPSGDALADSMEALVRRVRPDVITLQEAWVVAPERRRPGTHAVHVDAILERLPYTLAVPTVLSSRTAWRRNATGVPVLVRGGGAEVLEQTALPLGAPADDDASMAIRTHFRWQGREGVLYNLHLRSFGERKPWDDRLHLFEPGTWLPYLRQYRDAFRRRAAEVAQIDAQLDAETLPAIIAGDFNGTAANWTYRRLRDGRADAFRVAGVGAGHTYRADKPLVRIDFVLADTAWAVTEARVLPVGFSDHRPVVVRLRWRSEAEG